LPRRETLGIGSLIKSGVRLVGYSDTTVCLHDQLVGTRGDCVEVVWPVLGRGKLT
jgi:hypothetical protein